MSQAWANRQRRTNRLVHACYKYLVENRRVKTDTIYALCQLTWISKSYDAKDPKYIASIKMPALETIFRQDFSKYRPEEIARHIASVWQLPLTETKKLITEHTGFTNFYNVYRNTASSWIARNVRDIRPMLAQSCSLTSDNMGAAIARKIESLPGIPDPAANKTMRPEYLLTPLFFSLDSRLRFPIINGSSHVRSLLGQFRVGRGRLEEKYSALVSLIGTRSIKDAADLDQLRSQTVSIPKGLKNQFKLKLPNEPKKSLSFKDEDEYLVLSKQDRIRAKRTHNKLTNNLLKALQGYEIREGSVPVCRYDALVEEYYDGEDLLIEVKSSTKIADVRMAIGQLYDYHRQLKNRSRTSMAVLLPRIPGKYVKDLIKYSGMGLLYFSSGKLKEEW